MRSIGEVSGLQFRKLARGEDGLVDAKPVLKHRPYGRQAELKLKLTVCIQKLSTLQD